MPLVWGRPCLPDPGRPRGLGAALPRLPRQGRRQRVPALPTAAGDHGAWPGERVGGGGRARGARSRSGRRRPAIPRRPWSRTTRRGPASTTTGTCAAAATSAARSTTPPGTPSSTWPGGGSTRSPIRGEIVELAAGTGWWSPLLASKGELSLYDANAATLDRARDRLVAHGLRAHIHVRDAWAEPDRAVDAVFAGFWLSHIPRARLGSFLGLVHRWLKPGGRFAFIDSLPGPPVVRGRPPDARRRRLGPAARRRPRVHDRQGVLHAVRARGRPPRRPVSRPPTSPPPAGSS